MKITRFGTVSLKIATTGLILGHAVTGLAQTETPQFFAAPVPAPLAATTVTPVRPASTPVSVSQDWRLLDLGTSCVAETVTVVDGINHHLEVRVEKSNAATEIAIRSDVATSATVGYKAALGNAKTKVYSFAKLTPNGADEVFWGVPRGTEELSSFLKREMKFEVQASDITGPTATTISFSLRGSSATLANLGKKCADGSNVPTLADAAFEKAFLTSAIATQVAAVDFSRVTTPKADALRQSYNDARTAFYSSKVSQTEIEKLNAKYLREINELTGLRRNLDRLTQIEVTRLETARATAQAAIAQTSQEIQTLKPQIATNEASLVQANTDYEAAYAKVKPLLPEYNRLVGVIRGNESVYNQAQNRLNAANSGIAQANQDINQLQNQSRDLRLRLSSLQNESRAAYNDLNRATQDANNFDAPNELRRRLQSDSRIDNLQREIQNSDQRIQAQERASQQQEQERNRLNGELTNCRQTPGRDCSAEQNQLTDAQRRFQELRQGIEVLQNEKQRKQDEIRTVRDEIGREVQIIYDDLNRRVQLAQSRANEADSTLQDTENRLRAIEQIDIPSRQNDIARFNSDRSQAQTDMANADRRVRQARTDLANYRQSTGFDALQGEVDRTLGIVNGLKTELARIDREIKKREKLIADNNVTLQKVASDMAKVVAQIQAKEGRSADVQKALEPYELAKTDLTTKKAASDATFAAAQAMFTVNL